jgi:AcrR family transcriptional regulator
MPVDQISKNGEILEAARAVFIRHGIKKATMDDIAKMIPITRTALYYYYRNKDDLLRAVLDQEIEAYGRDLDHAVGQAGALVEKLAALSGCYCDFHDSIRSLFKFESENYMENYNLLKSFKDRVLDLNEAVIAGVLDTDPAVAGVARAGSHARLLGMSLRGILFNTADLDDEGRRRVLAQACRIFYHGLCAFSSGAAQQ